MNDRTARRYHWLSQHVQSFVSEPHDAIVGDTVRSKVLDMTAKVAEDSRKLCVDLVRGDPHNLVSSITRIGSKNYSLDRWSGQWSSDAELQEYSMPRHLDWKVFQAMYDLQPRDYEELIALRGVGPATVRALALVAELIYGQPASWMDPVKFSFAHGGKDGVPFPVNRAAMDQSIVFMREAVESARLGDEERVSALKRLQQFAGQWGL